jgi:DNA-binding NarL/FixJ family response regulator
MLIATPITTMPEITKVFHLEDYRIMRDGVRHLLSMEEGIQVAGEASSGDELLEKLKHSEVDVLILDIYLDSMQDLQQSNGFDLCLLVRQQYPNIKILAHSVYDDADRVAKIIRAGALGFVSKKSGFEELADGIKVVAKGNFYICSETSKRLKNLQQFLMGLENDLKAKGELFSQREREILLSLAEGKSSREIAAQLFITERTVDTHRKNMFEKSQVKNTAELIAFASALGLLRK